MCSQRFMIMRRRLSLGLALAAVLLASGCEPEGKEAKRSEPDSAQASASTTSSPPPAAPSGTAGVLEASWFAPSTNTDGSPLTDLAFYRLYYGTAGTPCPGSAFLQVASPTASPGTNDPLTYTLTGLSAGTLYFVAITAVDLGNLESACSLVASAVARSAGGPVTGPVGSIASGSSGGGPYAIQEPVLTGLTADLGPQLPGTTVTFTAMAGGGTTPYQFKWWLWDGVTWTVLEDWSIASTFAWIPNTPNPNYAVGVWVRSASNTANWPDSFPGNTGASRAISFAIN
jgi:hypothetical protein